MARRRFRYNKELDCFVEITDEGITYPDGSRYLWGDSSYKDLRTTDGVDISTRTKHREYMKVHGLTTYDDYKEHFKKEAQRRAEYYQTGRGGAVSREDVARAIHQLENKR